MISNHNIANNIVKTLLIVFKKSQTNINLFEPSNNIESSLKFTQLYDKVLDKLEDKNFEADNQLSLGQKQRLCLARTLHFNKDILIMDETISNLDKLLATNIINNLIKSSITLIYITHHFDEELMSKFDQTIHILSK
ncbi:ATP-binding cassette domain-containing protein [Mycoplasmopsis mucosicanis]|uniref:ATP-binding cassette domain-containing protein n=1 Tax=Mycoplasmopsis mucosicanis TaxID=458208 RepID=A0A507SQP1_9BACT|nr:ATP-binding cassette domain-containing protein [Mycoplasmopsis mucosicanis]TQC54107.1 ATP-binding cassette domain-containing protein [Mycoplasmopsis mucosicanis]